MPNAYIIFLVLISVLIFLYLIEKCYLLNSKLKELKRKLEKYDSDKKYMSKTYDTLNWNYQINKKVMEENFSIKYEPNRKIKILIADYYLISASITKQVFLNIGIDTDFVTNGEEVIEKIKNENDYDIIITNNVLDGKIDGVQTLVELKKIKAFNIPVIILTTSKDKDYFLKCGFDDYIEKILDIDKAKKSLKKVIKDLEFNRIDK